MASPSQQYSLLGKHVNIAMMTSGGLAPCLSSSIAQLMKYWMLALHEGKIAGLTFRIVPEAEWELSSTVLNDFGGSPIGNSRVKVRRERRKDIVWRRRIFRSANRLVHEYS
jgi:6-phosphofructokinase